MISRSAWNLVDDASDAAGVRLRRLERENDADDIVALIDRVWGGQLPPRELIRAMQHAGSVLYGAEADDGLVGFVWGFLGFAEGLHLHSHMLAVLPEWQARGVGWALKLAQRAACLDEGVGEVRWTYDPLVARNARFNLVKLGAEAVRFLPHFYGEMSDRLNRGDRTDRFEVRWRLESERVAAALDDRPERPDASVAIVERAPSADGVRPHRCGNDIGPGVRVAIPEDYQDLKGRHADAAGAWRLASARAFEDCFGAGLIATWVTEQAEYVFDRPVDR